MNVIIPRHRRSIFRDFTPLDLPNPILFKEGSDASTVQDTGGLVDQWDDKSGLGNDHIATGTGRPTTGTRNIGGLNGLDFNGTTNFMSRSDALGLTGNPDIYVSIVFLPDAPTSVDAAYMLGDDSVTGGRLIFYSPDMSFRYANGFQLFPNAGSSDVSVLFQRASGDTYADGLCWKDNVLQTQSGISGGTNTPTLDDEASRIGKVAGGTNFFNGVITQIVVGNAVLSSLFRDALHDYNAKYGV